MTVALGALLVASACGSGSDEAEDAATTNLVSDSEIVRLSSVMADIEEMRNHLSLTTSRMERQCMEDEGFFVHHEPPRTEEDFYVVYATPGSPPPQIADLPTSQEAAERGLGIKDQWIEYSAEDFRHSEIAPEEFVAQGRGYGEAYWETMNGHEQPDHSDLTPEEILELQEADPVAFGGCRGIVASQIYGVGAPGLEGIEPDDITSASAAPPVPEGLNLVAYELDFPTREANEVHRAWDECMTDRGHPSFPELYGMWAYVRSFYPDPPGTGSEQPWDIGQFDHLSVPPPADAPWDFDEAAEREIAFALDVASCADDVDYRAIMQHEWDQLTAAIVLEHETDIFIWRDQMEAALNQAQIALAE
ncbi:hypothetical protein [Natronoglycomyces albus]|uniref:Uncharacterized protein n=1 Tax=Natronoglycomyces albus TaxID=2811108 RepID=A0A895XSZ7_9ACTN|nr:hypothetical protein [Natronoglycomyces albus]QSB06385.1 hypothetical protein JQS30_05600 [Natronoglycomyces albus]